MSYKILGISGSPRHGGNTEVMVKEALEGAREVESIETELLTLAGKKIMPCNSCFKCVERKSLCIFKDKDYMGEFYQKWMEADGIIIGSPVYHLSVPGILKNALDRLGEGIWSVRKTSAIDSGWYCKVGGVMAQGLGTFGGQEYTIQYLVNHLLLMNCIVVPAEYLTVPGVVGTFRDHRALQPGLIGDYHPEALENSRILGKRVAEITKIVKMGVDKLQDELPEEYKSFVLTKDGFHKVIDNQVK